MYSFIIYASYKKKENIKVITGLKKAYEGYAKYPGKYYSTFSRRILEDVSSMATGPERISTYCLKHFLALFFNN